MPILKTTVRHDMDYAYRLYEKAEIRSAWKVHKESNIKDICMGNKRYLSCAAICEDEALVLNALLMREIDNSPANFYYNKEWKRLFMHCFSTEMDEIAVEKCYDKIIYEFVGRTCLKDISSDLDGHPLFWHRESRIKNQTTPLTDPLVEQKGLFLHSYAPVVNGHEFPFRL